MGCKTAEKIKENRNDAVEGETNSVTRQMSERKPRMAGYAGGIRGNNHLRPAKPVGGAPEVRLTSYRNFSCPVGAAGPSQLTREVLGGK